MESAPISCGFQPQHNYLLSSLLTTLITCGPSDRQTDPSQNALPGSALMVSRNFAFIISTGHRSSKLEKKSPISVSTESTFSQVRIHNSHQIIGISYKSYLFFKVQHFILLIVNKRMIHNRIMTPSLFLNLLLICLL